jgi:hypothetical protein
VKHQEKESNIFKSIKRNPFKRRKFVRKLMQVLDQHDDAIIPGRNNKEIVEVFVFQGYWCGVINKYFFNNDYGYNFDVVKRKFGR